MNTNRNDRPARAGKIIALVVAMLIIGTAARGEEPTTSTLTYVDEAGTSGTIVYEASSPFIIIGSDTWREQMLAERQAKIDALMSPKTLPLCVILVSERPSSGTIEQDFYPVPLSAILGPPNARIDALEKRVAALEALTSQTLTNHAREVKRVAPPQLIDGEERP